MADDIEYITFNNDVLKTTYTVIDGKPQPQFSAVVTGTVKVDYTNMTYEIVPGGVSVKGDNFSNGYGGGGKLVINSNGLYQIDFPHTSSNPSLILQYQTKTPDNAAGIQFYTDPDHPFNSMGYFSDPSFSGAPLISSPTPPPVCFASGTAIATVDGPVAVEHLAVGDRVLTVSGASRPVRWIGQSTLDFQHRARPRDMPIRIAAHAFGPGLPMRELHLSPGHPVLVGADADGEGGHLVPIMCLINGTTIERVTVDQVTYWHVELDAHDVLLAEGLPAESYLDWGDRAFFAEGADHALANPDFVVPGLAARCRPVAIDGPVVEAERRRLDAVFALQLVSACAWPTAFDALALS